MSKIEKLAKSVEHVKSSSMLALGGMTLYRRPMAFVLNLIRRYYQTGEPNNLTLLSFAAGMESDLLVGAGMVSRVRACYFGLEIFGLAPMFTYYANRGQVEVIEETEASLAFGLRAEIAGVGFMPGRGWLGTDLPKLRPDVKTILDPYKREELIAFPAIKPDVAVIHAIEADEDGNAIIGKNKCVDEELVLTSDKVIITSEKIVSPLEQVDIIGPLVHSLVLVPNGALPTSCHPDYPMDGDQILEYVEQVNDPSSYETYIKRKLNI
ncbi:MAG: CoA transferase subunit A [Anaerolineales bacterium]